MFTKTLLLSLVAVANAFPQASSDGADSSPLSPRNAVGIDEQIAARKQQYQALGKRQGALVPPVGESTANIARSKPGSVPYGPVLRSCTVPNTVALTFDDGPGEYTNELLDILASEGVKATFFMAGNNGQPGGMDSCSSGDPTIVRRVYNDGHQIASHSWTHPDMSLLSDQAFRDQIVWNEMAFRNILGVVPTYFRPPYLSCDGQCEARLSDLGYHTISVDLDTNDWQYQTDENNGIARGIFTSYFFDASGNVRNPRPNGALVLAHDIHRTSVQLLARHMISEARRAGYSFATVGECLGDPRENWYRPANGQVTCGGTTGASSPAPAQPPAQSPAQPPAQSPSPPPAGLAQTTDGTCGANGRTCLGYQNYECCSQWNWCGNTPEHCGGGCQAGFGRCG